METEIVDVDEFMPAICWTRCFIASKGYNFRDNCLYEDNKSSTLLEKNGKAPSSKMTSYMNIQYLFITDRVKNG